MSAENKNLSKHLQTHCGEVWRCWNSKGKHFIGANYKVSYDTKKSGGIRKHIPVSVSQQFILLIKHKLNQLFFFPIPVIDVVLFLSFYINSTVRQK